MEILNNKQRTADGIKASSSMAGISKDDYPANGWFRLKLKVLYQRPDDVAGKKTWTCVNTEHLSGGLVKERGQFTKHRLQLKVGISSIHLFAVDDN